jgi:prophage DNA circulation protein
MSDLTEFLSLLQPASLRGVPFAVLGSDSRFGRRVDPHEYPFRDKPWIEDLGRGTRKITLSGFLISDSGIYGGGDVLTQRDALVAAAETKGAGTLVHPTLGNLTVSIPDDGLTVTERWDRGRYFEITIECYESGDRVFPAASNNTAAGTNAAADQSDLATALDFVNSVRVAIARGAAVIKMAVRTVTGWVGMVTRLAGDATSLFNMLVDLPGQFGRYFPGRTTGFASSQLQPASTATVDSLIYTGVADRAAVALACSQLIEAAGAVDPTLAPPAAAAVAAALQAACANPADATRILAQLVNFYPSQNTSASNIGQAEATMQTAMGAVCRRSAIAAFARATALYQPSSSDDAAALRTAFSDVIDGEITIAGDNGDDNSYMALRALRAAVILDLNTRGASLPAMQTEKFATSLPALVTAQILYQDPSRTEELILEADPPHPAFMPASFKALSS